MTLLERDKNAPPAWLGNLPVTSRYTFGLAGERFFRTIKDEGKITGTYCPKCEHTYVPGVLFCERCLSKLEKWVDVGVTGTVHTFTQLFETLDGSPNQEPQLIAFITLGDGGIIHHLGEIEPEDIDIGMVVEAVFKPPEDRTGAITDILYFKRI
jgi:uncharacterized OB-fold protein